jgi:peptidyl-prolyl cis-trans isomerase SurA
MKAAYVVAAAVVVSAGPARARVVEKIAAVVNEEIILASEIEEKAAPFMRQVASITNAAQRAARAAALRREVLDRLIDEKLVLGKARELKLTVSSEDVDRSIEQIKRDHNLTDEQLREALEQQGMSMASYRNDIKNQVLRFKVLGIAVGSKVSISDRELQDYYDRNFKTGQDGEVRASHIFIAIPEDADTGTVVEKQKTATALATRAKSGEDFAQLAKQHSEDAATRAEGGDLGYFGRDLLPRPIEEVVFSMKVGEVRGPVRAERGFHVMKLVDKRAKDVKSFDDAKEEIRGKLRQRAVEKQTKSWVAELRRRALIDVRI